MTALIQKDILAEGKDLRVIAAGVSGDTTADALARLPRYLLKENVIEHAVIELGTNDFFQGFPVSTMRENFKRIVLTIRKFDSRIQIFLMQMKILPGSGESKAYESMFGELSAEFGLVLLPFPFSGVIGHPELNLSDGVHPNAKGTEIVAANVWNSLRLHL